MSTYPHTLYLIRHAPVAASGRYTGQRDVPCLIPAGLFETPRLPQHWFTSDLSRARDSARWLAAELGVSPTVTEHTALREQHFGAWEGEPYDAVYAAHPEIDWENPATLKPPGGESFAEVCQRVAAFMQNHLDGEAVIVSHAGSIRAALAHALGMTPAEALQLVVEPGSLTCVQGGRLAFINRPFFMPPAGTAP